MAKVPKDKIDRAAFLLTLLIAAIGITQIAYPIIEDSIGKFVAHLFGAIMIFVILFGMNSIFKYLD